MCDPVTAVTAGSAILGGFMQYQQGRAQAAALKASADSERVAAEYEQDRLRDRQRRMVGSQRTAAAASGVQIESYEDAILDSFTEAELDIAAAKFSGEIRARAKESEARLAKQAGTAGLISGAVGAGTTVLGSDFGKKLLN